MRKISTLKRAGYVGLALGLGLLSTPVLVGGSVYADEECTGPTDVAELSAELSNWWSSGQITLCGDIEGTASVTGRQVTINLNGHTIINESGNALSASNWYNMTGKMTITGEGTVIGGLSGNLDLRGGVYSNNPSNFVKNPLSAYQRKDGKYVVEVTLVDQDVEVTPTRKSIRVGKTFTIVTSVASESTTTFDFTGYDESIISVSEAGVVTGLAAGTTTVTVSSTYEPTITRNVDVSVYGIEAIDEDDAGAVTAAETLADAIDAGYLPKDPKTASDEAKEVFGQGKEYRSAHEAIRSAMGAGSVLTTEVLVDDEVEPTEEEVAMVEEALADYNVDEISYYDVSVLVGEYGDPVAQLHKLNNKIAVVLTTVEDPADGYTRQYLVVRLHNGEATLLTEGEDADFYIKDGKLYVNSDLFSMFAVSYVDTKNETVVTVKAPETGAVMTDGDSASADSVSLGVATVFVLAATTLAGAFIFAKRK